MNIFLNWLPPALQVCQIKRVKALFHLSQSQLASSQRVSASFSLKLTFEYCDWIKILAATLQVDSYDKWKYASKHIFDKKILVRIVNASTVRLYDQIY